MSTDTKENINTEIAEFLGESNVPAVVGQALEVEMVENYMSADKPDEIDEAAVAEVVDAFMQKLNDNPTDMTLSSDVYKIGTKSATIAMPNVQLYDTLISNIMKDQQAGPVDGSKEYNMLQLKREMDMVNPAVLAQTPVKQKFLIFFSKANLPGTEKIMDMIYERKETVKSSIDGIKVALLQNANDLDHQMADLMMIYKGLLTSHNILKSEIYTAKLIYNKLVDLDIKDPIAKENVNTVLADLTTQINSLLVEENMNAQFFAGSQLTAKLVREQQNQIRILVRQMEKAVLANLGLRVVAKGLEDSVNASKALGSAIANTIADTAKANEKTADKLIQARTEGYIDLAKLQEGVDALTRTFEKEAKANQLIIQQGLSVAKKIKEATVMLESKIDKEV